MTLLQHVGLVLCCLEGMAVPMCCAESAAVQASPPWRLTNESVREAAGRLDSALMQQLTPEKDDAPPVVVPVRCTDEVFLRRACIDLAGRLPRAAEVRAFLADPGPDKRSVMVDRLLGETAASDWRFQRLADALRVTDEVLGASQKAYVDWLKQVVRDNLPFDELIRRLLMAEGTLNDHPETGFLLRDAGEVKVLVWEMSRAFLGDDVHCAQCHDHPFSNWTQMDLHQFDACLSDARVIRRAKGASPQSETGVRMAISDPSGRPKTLLPGAKPVGRRSGTRGSAAKRIEVTLTAGQLWPIEVLSPAAQSDLRANEELVIESGPLSGIALPSNYRYRDGKSGQIVPAKLPAVWERWQSRLWTEIPRAPGALTRCRSRQDLANWLTSPANPRFAATTAIRVWGWLFGDPYGKRLVGWVPGESPPMAPAEVLRLNSCQESPGLWGWNAPWTGLNTQWTRNKCVPMAEALSREFIAAGMDRREFTRIIAHTEAYQRTCSGGVRDSNPGSWQASPALRRLPAEVVWDALVSWQPEEAPDWFRTRSIDSPQTPAPDHPLRWLGRGSRNWADETNDEISFALVRFLMTGDPVKLASDHLASPMEVADALVEPGRQVDEWFLEILGRSPTEPERQMALSHLASFSPEAGSTLCRALINSASFLFEP